MKAKLNFFSLLLLVSMLNLSALFSQETKYKVGCIGFYNLENLFDTENDPNIEDEEFLPGGGNVWTEEKYAEKLGNMAGVIAKMGADITGSGPAILGVCEIENRKVLEDLIATDALKAMKYEIVHYDSPDKRGVDVGLLYQPKYFTVENSKNIKVDIGEHPTRDILLVSGKFDGEELHILVNHWPSRSGGQKKSEPRRIIAAEMNRTIIDSILKINPKAKIVVMGDLNDNPTDKSIKKYLKSTDVIEEAKDGILYNPMVSKYNKGNGTTAHRDTWGLFDQLIISEGLIGTPEKEYKFYNALIFKEKFLIQSSGKYEGYPFRTFSGGKYAGGYSDHLPVYLFIRKEKK